MSVLLRSTPGPASVPTPIGSVTSSIFDGGEFQQVLKDESIDPEERAMLKKLQQQRLREEAAHKQRLKLEFEQSRLEEEHQQMTEFKKIAEQKQLEKEEREREIRVCQPT